MPNLEARIEAALLFRNEPVSVSELSKWLGEKPAAVKEALENLRAFYQNRGVAIVFDGESAAFGTHPETSALIETLQKEEFSRELGRAGLEARNRPYPWCQFRLYSALPFDTWTGGKERVSRR